MQKDGWQFIDKNFSNFSRMGVFSGIDGVLTTNKDMSK